MVESAPGLIACSAKNRMLAELRDISRGIAFIEQQELELVLAGRSPDNELNLRLNNARELRRLVMCRLRDHVVDHDC